MSLQVRSYLILAVLSLTYGAAWSITPKSQLTGAEVAIAGRLPQQFGGWVEESDALAQVDPSVDGVGGRDQAQRATYDEVLMRTYQRRDGKRVMMALAYGRKQTQELKIHRPELCYRAQGFEVTSLGARALRLGPNASVTSTALVTRNRNRVEIVTYWIRIGDRVTRSAWETRWTLLREGLAGRVPDGLLVRTSSLAPSETDAGEALAVQRDFLVELYGALAPPARKWLTGV